jgi:hypothetical protein
MSKKDHPESPKKSPKGSAAKDEQGSPAKPRKQIPLVSVPHDRDMLADEMAELFEEDQVTHQHGRTEPERD